MLLLSAARTAAWRRPKIDRGEILAQLFFYGSLFGPIGRKQFVYVTNKFVALFVGKLHCSFQHKRDLAGESHPLPSINNYRILHSWISHRPWEQRHKPGT